MQFRLASLLALAFALVSIVQGTENVPKDFKGGGKDTVKDWKPRAYETIKPSLQPTIVYVFDPDPKKNELAFRFETKEGLENAEIKEKIAKFTKVKIKNDGPEAKGWPEEYTKPADKGALLILMSSDLTLRVVFDKSKPIAERNTQAILGAIKGIQAHEEKLKAERAEKAAKEEKAAAAAQAIADAKKKEEPQPFTIEVKKEKDKKAGEKTADVKKDVKKDGKKLPEDE